ncbi:hypothetical protein [Geoalkalibacter subterraneus]|uniref:Uncharacterized protein n=1 Tax=Geoalkalibacter subterraneus TaxID=483547 RepID=A0A0B5FLD2_9BACT|nr:hypothetical protein [Geoalkalibacter subterraneus]AJF08218.1 hypothetical protein GSUB_17165 [Geoalkalibacter subterraneus]
METPKKIKTNDHVPLSVIKAFAAQKGLTLIVSPEDSGFPDPYAFLTSRDGKTEIKLVRETDDADPVYRRSPFFHKNDKYARLAAEFNRCGCENPHANTLEAKVIDVDFQRAEYEWHTSRMIYYLSPCSKCNKDVLHATTFCDYRTKGVTLAQKAAASLRVFRKDPSGRVDGFEKILDLYCRYTGVQLGLDIFENTTSKPKPSTPRTTFTVNNPFGVWF